MLQYDIGQWHAWCSTIMMLSSSAAAASYLAGAGCCGEAKGTTGAAGCAAGVIVKLGNAATQASSDVVEAVWQDAGFAIHT
jgi:hypothetical protein